MQMWCVVLLIKFDCLTYYIVKVESSIIQIHNWVSNHDTICWSVLLSIDRKRKINILCVLSGGEMVNSFNCDFALADLNRFLSFCIYYGKLISYGFPRCHTWIYRLWTERLFTYEQSEETILRSQEIIRT